MSYFLFILNILLILFKISSQNQNNISLNETNQSDINFIKDLEKNILSLKEKPELLKNLAMLIFNDKEIDIKFVDDLVEMIKKNRTMLDYILLVANNTKGFPVIFKIIHNFLHYHNETMELLLNFNYVFPFIFDFLKYFNIKIIDYFFYILIDKDFLELTKKLGLIIIKNETILDNLFGIFEDNKLIAIFENKIQTKEYINNIFNGILDVIYKNESINLLLIPQKIKMIF